LDFDKFNFTHTKSAGFVKTNAALYTETKEFVEFSKKIRPKTAPPAKLTRDTYRLSENPYSKPEEGPEKLDLNRKNLVECPVFKEGKNLKLIDLQNNFIRRIENFIDLPNLVFIDLYNNQIEED
jgi:Leucine-rich repeat (LRR) protein